MTGKQGWHSQRKRHSIASKKGWKNRKKTKSFKKPFNPMPKSFHLAIETAVYVPSTTLKDKPVSKRLYAKRIKDTRLKLSNMLGGYTSVTSIGGYIDKKGKLIREPVTKVTAFSTKPSYIKHRKEYVNWLLSMKRKWGQESIGYEYEGDLYYF